MNTASVSPDKFKFGSVSNANSVPQHTMLNSTESNYHFYPRQTSVSHNNNNNNDLMHISDV